jgi:hypothetical protein
MKRQSGTLLGAKRGDFACAAKLLMSMTFAAKKVRFSRSTIAALVALLFVLSASAAHAQSGTLGSTSSPVVNAFGRPMAGVDVSICQPAATTAAQVISNTAVLTMASNPVTAGFAAGMLVQVSGFTGADTYFNGGTFTNGTGITGGYTILSVTSTTITYALTHANATASSNGTVLQQGSGTTGCAGLSAVYTDPGMTQPLAQPIVTDAYGNWNAFAQSGQLYYVQFYGTGVTTSMRWIMVNVTTNAAVKPQSSDAVQHVSPNGSDSNDGLSMGTAKLTLLGAYNGLPSTGGTIYVSGSGVQCTSVSGQGLGIAGSGDPNYASMPAVLGNVQWVKAKAKSVSIQGLSAGTDQGQNATYGWATNISCGNATTPAFWLSGVTAFEISHIMVRTASIGARVSIDSTGARGNGSNLSTNIRFANDDFFSVSGGGPVIDSGGGLTWFRVTDTLLENGAGQASTSDAASGAYFSNGNAATSLGLIYFDHVFFTGGGGVRFDSCTGSSGSFYMQRALMQGSGNSQPLYEVTNTCGGVVSDIILEGGESDSGTNIPVVRIPAGMNPCATNVSGASLSGLQYAWLEGPLTVGAGQCSPNASGGTPTYAELTPLANVIPAAKWQRNGPYGISINDESYRRSFSPTFVRFANLAAQSPASWVANLGTGNSLTQIQGPGDPSGVTNAATLNCTANGGQGGCDYYAYNNNLTLSAGDYIYVGVWAQPASTTGFAVNTLGVFGAPIGLEQVSNPSTLRLIAAGPNGGGIQNGNIFSNPYYQTDGNWQWIWALAKVTAPSGSLATFKVHLAFLTGFPVNYYAPMFVRIPASSVALVVAPTFSSASETGNTVTFTTTAAHNLYGAMPVIVSGCSVGGYNGEWVVTGTPTSTTFTLYNPTSGLGAPTGCVITPGNDSEVADWANNIAPYGDNCTTGTLCGIRGVTVPKVVASGTSTLGNSAIGAGACAAVVTSSGVGVATTDRIEWAYASAPATADGLLMLSPYVTSGNVNWKLCNPTASSQTPSGLVVNWEVLR